MGIPLPTVRDTAIIDIPRRITVRTIVSEVDMVITATIITTDAVEAEFTFKVETLDLACGTDSSDTTSALC